jgi:hypothetical protein
VDFLMVMMIVEKEGKERVWAEQQKKSRGQGCWEITKQISFFWL